MNRSTLHRTFIALTWLLFLITGCNTTTRTPAVTAEDNPTTGALARSTREARASLEAQATATRQAHLAGTATQVAAQAAQIGEAHAHATATLVARATARAIVAEKTAWPLQIREAFTDNRLGWPLGLKQDHSLAVTSTLAGGSYRWVVKVVNGNSYFNLVPTHPFTFTNFYAGVNVQFGPGSAASLSAYGLAFRHVDNDYGFFGIKPSGDFLALEVHHTGIYQSIGGRSPAIDTQPGHTNRLEVVARGSDFVFLINGQMVGMLTAEIDPGQIGLGVDAARRADTAQVEFTNFEVHAP